MRLQTLGEYLQENWEQDVVEHALRVYMDSDGQTCFCIHPKNVNGETLDFMVEENELEGIDNKIIDAELVTDPG